MAFNIGRVAMYNKKFPSIKSSDPLISWSSKVTQNILAAVSLLPQGLWTLNLAERWLPTKKIQPIKSHNPLNTWSSEVT